MPPRRGSQVAGEAEQPAANLVSLPHALLLCVFSLLAVDARAACSAVCRGWRAMLLDHSCWLRLDLSHASGIVRAAWDDVTDTFLQGAAARAGGRLVALDVSQCFEVSHAALLAVVTANAGTLRELRMCNNDARCHEGDPDPGQVEALLRAAPQLHSFDTSVTWIDDGLARRMLRGEPPFERLRISRLLVHLDDDVSDDEDALATVLADAAAHESLVHLGLSQALLDVPAALDAVVAFALAHRLQALWLCDCALSPASAPALARLLGGDALRELYVYGLMNDGHLLDEPAAMLLANALRANSTLTQLAFELLLRAATAHPSLRKLELQSNTVDEASRELAGRALGALVAANAPSLEELDVNQCDLGDEGLRPLVDALASNTHLRLLHWFFNARSEAFFDEQLLPAIRAHPSMTTLA
jgi:hypothetical protein